MRLQLRCHGDIDLSQPGMQVEIRSHIARCLRDYPNGEGVITLGRAKTPGPPTSVLVPQEGPLLPLGGRNQISRPFLPRFRVQ